MTVPQSPAADPGAVADVGAVVSTTMTFDPVNSTADGLYSQLRTLAAKVQSYNNQIAAMTQQVMTLTAARDADVAEMRSLRTSITIALVGFDVP